MNKFRFFSDNLTLEKSSKDGKDVYLVGGLITDSSTDADGENLVTEGLDFSEFNFINWNHSKEPGDIIGTPLTWEYIKGKGVTMKGELYTDIPKANDAIKLMKTLQRSGRKNRLGWSIEGQVIERDLIDSSKVKKAKITAVALCPFPKNGNTFADLLTKGFSGDDCFQSNDKLEYDEETNGGLVEIQDEDNKIKVDSKGNITYEKAQTIENSAALIKEDVEGNEKIDMKKAFVIITDAHKNNEISTENYLKKARIFTISYLNKK